MVYLYLYHFRVLRWYMYLKSFLVENKENFILLSQWRGCWWPGDARIFDISNHGVDLVPHNHDNVIKWKHFPHYWPFVRGIHRWPVNSPHKGQWRGALMFSLICAWINSWVNNRGAGDLKRHHAHYDVTGFNLSNRRKWLDAMQASCHC